MAKIRFGIVFLLFSCFFSVTNTAGKEPAVSHEIEVVVHRGANHLAPENTWASAQAALEKGATWIEVDVRCSRDHVLYNLHDPLLNRTTNGKGYIGDWLSADIDQLDAGSWFSSRFKGVHVPRMSVMLDSLKGRSNVFFDVKSGTPVADLIKLVRAKGFTNKSFFWFGDSNMLKAFVKLAPEMKIKVNASDVVGIKRWMKICRPSYVEISPRYITDDVKSFCRKNGIKIMAAVLEGAGEDAYREAISKQPDLVNIDRPELFLRLIQEQKDDAAIKQNPLSDYVDPRIGSEGLGRVFIGPAYPFGMVRPSPDCTVNPNSGWLPMPEQVNGFAQVHVSGTGGGPKYGNILVMPFTGGQNRTSYIDYRKNETMKLGYYATTFRHSNIKTEITTARRASFYRFTYPADSVKSLLIDAGFFLGEQPVPDAREAQQFVGSEIRIVSDHAVAGYSRIRGGWNNGKAYTVYFYAETDRPFIQTRTWKNDSIQNKNEQYDSGKKVGSLLRFAQADSVIQLKVGISFVSELKARENCREDIPEWSFEQVRNKLVYSWEKLFHKIEIPKDTPLKQKRMFYTALYHTMLMPSDRTGDNPLWTDAEPYYDDFYAIWDTYRTSLPLITLIDPEREVSIVRSLINIYKRDGYMPDARSGNCNGRTQGGSNAEIVIADAFAKQLPGINYEEGLKAMLKDATVPPGGNEEAEGRGGLVPYLQLGYIPYGIPRAGNRTVEYSTCDYAIAQVAKGLGHTDLYKQYLKQSGNWRNLWRADYTYDGVKGFIMPKDEKGNWLDDISFGHSNLQKPTFRYTPVTFEGPWYTPWWDTFFYEGTSWEYSICIPHAVPEVIQACGGAGAFERRLDKFFDKGYFNVNNEPSFIAPCLYHWIGKPWRSSDRIREIISRSYNDGSVGLPGNDDSGAMSSWLAFHFMGIYPNAGEDYYLINSPFLKETVIKPADGVTFTIKAQGLSDKKRYIIGAELNGKPYPYSAIRHSAIVKGGVLVLKMGEKPTEWGKKLLPDYK